MKKFYLKQIILCLCLFSGGKTIAYDLYLGGVYYNLNTADQTATVTRKGANMNTNYDAYVGAVTIPPSFTYNGVSYTVTAIGEYAFDNCKDMTSVSIPGTVTKFEQGAFRYCSGLESFHMPNGITEIGKNAFLNCTGIKDVYFDNVESMCNIEYKYYDANPMMYADNLYVGGVKTDHIVIPETVTFIRSCAFSSKSLQGITIPKSVSHLQPAAFQHANNLKDLVIADGDTPIRIYYDERYTTYSDGKPQFSSCPLETVYIGRDITIENGKNYGFLPFYNKTSLVSVTIGQKVTAINENMFHSCANLSSLTILDGVKTIGKYAFEYCTSLNSVRIPASVDVIDRAAFTNCKSLRSLTIADCVRPLQMGYILSWDNKKLTMFRDCPLDSLYLGRNVAYDPEVTALSNQSLSYLRIGDYVTSLQADMFKGVTKIQKVEFGSMWQICSKLIYGNSYANPMRKAMEKYVNGEKLSRITIPEDVNYINDYAFYGFGVAEALEFHEKVDTIGEYAFNGVNVSDNITLPDNIKYIGRSAFTVYYPNNILVHRGTTTLLALWNSEYEQPRELGTSAKLNRPTLKIVSKTQASVTVGLSSKYDEYQYFINDTPWDGNQITINGLRPEYQGMMTLRLSLGDVSYIYNKEYTTDPLNAVVLLTPSGSSLKVNGSYTVNDANIIAEEITLNGVKAKTGEGHFCGLDPESTYPVTYSVTVAYGDNGAETYQYVTSAEGTTQALQMVTQQPKVITVGNVIVAAESNLDDEETNVGFEWRRTDWTDDFASNTGIAYLYEGKMEGYIRNLYTEKLWKYRPFYESNEGNRYYGEWVGIDPTNTSYFEPTVHTYSEIEVDGNRAKVKGYVMRGTDNIDQQGFYYWKNADEARGAGISAVDVPDDAMKVVVNGNVMTAELKGLDYSSEYCVVAFVRTVENEMFYGEKQLFKISNVLGDINGDGKVDVSDYIGVANYILNIPQEGFNEQAGDVNEDGAIDVSDYLGIGNIIHTGSPYGTAASRAADSRIR